MYGFYNIKQFLLNNTILRSTIANVFFVFMKLEEKGKSYNKRNKKKEMAFQILKLGSTLHIRVPHKLN